MTIVRSRPRGRTQASAVPALWRQVVGNAPSALDRAAAREHHRTVPVEPDRSAFLQLELYEGMLKAFDHRAEVLDVIATCSDRDTAVARLAEQLGLNEDQAIAVLDLQLHRFTDCSRHRIAHRAAELRTALGC